MIYTNTSGRDERSTQNFNYTSWITRNNGRVARRGAEGTNHLGSTDPSFKVTILINGCSAWKYLHALTFNRDLAASLEWKEQQRHDYSNSLVTNELASFSPTLNFPRNARPTVFIFTANIWQRMIYTVARASGAQLNADCIWFCVALCEFNPVERKESIYECPCASSHVSYVMF